MDLLLFCFCFFSCCLTLLLAVAAYKNGDYGLSECSRVYGVPKELSRDMLMKRTPFEINLKQWVDGRYVLQIWK